MESLTSFPYSEHCGQAFSRSQNCPSVNCLMKKCSTKLWGESTCNIPTTQYITCHSHSQLMFELHNMQLNCDRGNCWIPGNLLHELTVEAFHHILSFTYQTTREAKRPIKSQLHL
ncbi:hypothetical protein E2C01_003087 [Portunus trituberculatus]|uniref:Uncharacterized protein n=1 Tax=Portunus trituberculatus TaxID=210409 RepID=A0A5B7CNT3_PORTR|nr:hypothetical protein [Portunus trituberculatus]